MSDKPPPGQILICSPPWHPALGGRGLRAGADPPRVVAMHAPDAPWPEELASATAWLLAHSPIVPNLIDSVATGESLESFRLRLAELFVDHVLIATSASSLAEDLQLIETCAPLRPTTVWWPGEPAGAETLLHIPGVRAVVCGEPERALQAALQLADPGVLPGDPVADLDDLPRPYRDYLVYRYRLPLAGLPATPQLLMRAGRRGRWHSAEWLADDLACCRHNYPLLSHVVLADRALDAEPERFAAFLAVLRAGGLPWAVRVEGEPAALAECAGAAALEVEFAHEPEAASVAALAELAAGGTVLTFALAPDVAREGLTPLAERLGATITTALPSEPVVSFTTAVQAAQAVLADQATHFGPSHSTTRLPRLAGRDWRRVYVVGQHNSVYMPPWLVRAALELGHDAAALDPWQDPRAILELPRTQPQDIVLVDRGLGVHPEVLARTPGRTVLYWPDNLPVGEDAPEFAQRKYTDEFLPIAPHYDDVILHDGHPLAFLLARGHANVRGAVMLPYDPERYRDLGRERDLDVLFVGLESEHRRRWMDHLAAQGVSVHWPQVWGDAYVEALNRAKIVLNLHTLPTPNTELRLCEAMACGCFVVSEPVTRPPRFVDGEHYVETTWDDAAETIRAWLARPDDRAAIARRAQAYVAEHFTARHVLADLLALLAEVRP